MIGALALEVRRSVRGSLVEVVDQSQALVDVASPRIGDRNPVKRHAAAQPERIEDRTRVTNVISVA